MTQQIQIQPRDVYEHFIYVNRPGTTLHWTFTTKKKNVHFGLFYRAGLPMTTLAKRRFSKEPDTTRRSISIAATEPAPQNSFVPLKNNIETQNFETSSATANHNGGKRASLVPGSSIHQLRGKSTASSHLIDNQFQEIIPISHTHSSERQIHGSFKVPDSGNCVLLFDNTNSINTSKVLHFSVTSDEPIEENEEQSGIHEMTGFLLKKRRKRLQGWAKRWFEISPGGTLSYSVSPGGIKRGSIQITMTMVTIYPKQRTIHLDTGTTVYHLKALTKEDFDRWVESLRRQRAIGLKDKNTGILVDGTWLLPDSRYRLTPNPLLRIRQQRKRINGDNGEAGKYDSDADGDNDNDDDDDEDDDEEEGDDYFEQQQKEGQYLGREFEQLTEHLASLNTEVNQLKLAPALSLPDVVSNSTNCSNTINTPTLSTSTPYDAPLASPTPSAKRRFTFRRGSSQIQATPTNNTIITVPVCHTHDSTDRLAIRHQQQHIQVDTLIQSIQRISELTKQIQEKYDQQYRYWTKTEKCIQRYQSSLYQQQSQGTPRTLSFYSYHSSNHSDLYYDAEEFELTLDRDDDMEFIQEKEDDSDDSNSVEDVQRNDSDEAANDTSSLLSSEPSLKLKPLSLPASQAPSSPLPGPSAIAVRRRRVLSHPVAGKSVNLLGLLRKNVGRDLSSISMPVSLNEPLNLLQRLCEELEYSNLLDTANQSEDSLERLIYVAVFAVTGFASSQYRIGRKFWNPLLFETYECIRPDKGFRFISEKVSHRPNIVACHAESSNFTFWQSTEGSTKFWGKSMEFISEGTVHVKLPKHGDHFTYTKPSSHMRNMIFGTCYLEHLGQIRVTNQRNGNYAMVTFKEARRNGADAGYYFGGGSTRWERNEVEVLVYSNKDNAAPLRKLTGKWSQSIMEDLGEQKYKLIWQVQPPTVEQPSDYYGFTQFCMELNEITPIEQGHLPPTDTRYRPDQRFFEEGNVDEAEKEKERLEVSQRVRRSQHEAAGASPVPTWFQRSTEHTNQWEYKGGYWEARSSGQWPASLPHLW